MPFENVFAMLVAGIGLLLFCFVAFYASYSISSGVYVKAVCRIPAAGKSVALTFDDGVNPETTPWVLDILRKHGVKAAFFVIGEKVDACPGLVERIAREGHSIGNHSYFHRNTFPLRRTSKMVDEIKACDAAVYGAAGTVPRFFRPPFGVTNPMVGKAVRRTGKIVAGWSIRSLDTMGKPVEKTLARIEHRLRDGAIILLHDDRANAACLLEKLVECVHERGYKFVLLDELLGGEYPLGGGIAGFDAKTGRK